MKRSIHEAVWEWLQTCPYIFDLFFNISQTDSGDTQLIPSETVKIEYLDGSSERYYNVALMRYMVMSDNPNDMTNLSMTVDFEEVADWIDEQFKSGTLPELPEGMSINNIEVLPNESGFMSPEQGNIGKYILQFRIEYFRDF